MSGRLPFPEHSLTLILRGSFDLAPREKATPAEDQPFPTGDEFYEDDEERLGGPRYESDFACFKPRADLVLVGNCHTPGGMPSGMCGVSFQVGDRVKKLIVLGDRLRKRRGGHWQSTDPEPFTRMELRYENSLGGPDSPKNPSGKGYREVEDDTADDSYPLPNIEDPQALSGSGRDQLEPAGFAPLARAWQTRQAKMGTYEGKWLGTRWPWFPEDFDWGHFNAAPDDLQIEGYLRGDERVRLENLHPEHSRYEFRLPGLRPRCFVNRQTEPAGTRTGFDEVEMNLDTLWVDMESERLVLVWRGWTEVASEEYEEVRDLFVLSEPLEQEPATVEECCRRFLDTQAEEERTRTMTLEPPTRIRPASDGESDPSDRPGPKITEKPGIDSAELERQVNAVLAQAGMDIDGLPPEVRDPIKEQQARIIRQATETDPEKLMARQQAELEDQLRDEMAKLGLDMDNLPPISAKARAEQARLLKELGMGEADLSRDPEIARLWPIMAAVMPKMGMDPENLDPLIGEARKQQERLGKQFGIGEDEEDPEIEDRGAAADQGGKIPLTREQVRERLADGGSLEGEDLRGLDLSGMDMRGGDCSGANLSGADLQGTLLTGANLTGTDLTGTNLSDADLSAANLARAKMSEARLPRANLKQADLARADLARADMTGAVLDEAVLERANLRGAVLDRVSAVETWFPGADLTGVFFKQGVCSKADFSKALLTKADFEGASLREASVEGASGRKVNFAQADLTKLRASGGCDFSQGVFRRAQGRDSIWEKANLAKSDFRYARMEGATFTSASLEQADLSAADMRHGRFNKANLKAAKLVRMNLFRGSLEKANLRHADLSGSNMYGVELWQAALKATALKGTNLKGTKLHD